MENKELTPEEKTKKERKKRNILIVGLGCLGLIILSCIISSFIIFFIIGNSSEKKAKKEHVKLNKRPTETIPETSTEKEVEPILFLTTTLKTKSLKNILKNKYKDNFWESTIGANNNRIMWCYETKVYSGFISFDIIPTQQEKIITSTLNFTIYPEFKNNKSKFKKAWKEAEGLISKWIEYFSGEAIESEDILPLYYSTLEQAQENYTNLGMSFRYNTFNIRTFGIKIKCDIKGLITIELSRK